MSTGRTVLGGARVVTPSGVLEDGWVAIEDGKITGVGTAPAPPGPLDAVGGWLLPGFIDLHVHGGGGHGFSESPEALVSAVGYHRRHGTTRTLVSFSSAPESSLVEQLGWAADIVASGSRASGSRAGGGVIGAHLEGPFLSVTRRGAHNAEHLLMPDRRLFARFAEAARGTLRAVTVAPELPGALELIGDVIGAGAVAAIGHTDASYAEACAGFGAGASLATHLFNGMRPMLHREPGAAGAALSRRVACEVINDGVHLHPSVTMLVAEVPERLVLVTDAVQAGGLGDGEHLVGGRHLEVSGGQVRLAGTDVLAGSSLTMDVAVRRAVRECGLAVTVASAAASGNPARVLGIDGECGSITVGRAADLVVMDADFTVSKVMTGGQWAQ